MFGPNVIDASLIPAMSVALFAGIISFIGPSVLPFVPPYLAHMSGMTVRKMAEGRSGRNKATITALFLVLGLSTVFIFLGFAASAFDAFFLQSQVLFSQISGAVIMVFGSYVLGVLRTAFLTARRGRMLAIKADRLSAPMLRGWPLPLAGHPASALNWARFWSLWALPCCWACSCAFHSGWWNSFRPWQRWAEAKRSPTRRPAGNRRGFQLRPASAKCAVFRAGKQPVTAPVSALLWSNKTANVAVTEVHI